ncbi:hypothetical protein PVT01_000015700 [Plasmodium vivax]|uniref:Uncharacterized protein n=1 Tax=Plasmodium vivax TaxID=5855 RepID=A0A1G4EBD5_PLAVI|nr:hypothetical protein PVT01_000015700 [Plasmodium vivax]
MFNLDSDGASQVEADVDSISESTIKVCYISFFSINCNLLLFYLRIL